jgi:hypothetical protein
MIKKATDRRGWLKYMAKEENVPGWRSWNNFDMDREMWKVLRIEYVNQNLQTLLFGF